MSETPYGLFCPIAKACEILERRWTMPILAEMSCGTTRFNDLRRGMPRISPALLSKRLKEMEKDGLVERVTDKASGTVDYLRTPSAMELHPILVALGHWAQRHVDTERALCDCDAPTLMWLLRRKINTDALPPTRIVMRIHFTDASESERNYWIVARPGQPVDLCLTDPGFDVDLYLDTEVAILTGVLFGRYSLVREIEQERIRLIGAPRIRRTIGEWLKLSYFAPSASQPLMDAPTASGGRSKDEATKGRTSFK